MTNAMLTNGNLQASSLFAAWQQQLNSAPQILVALSGGLDSTVLLHLLLAALPAERLYAVHINHGLSKNADYWQSAVEGYCQSLGVRLHSETVEVVASGEGIEAAARSARYSLFEELLQKDGLLLLGHHADDQVETMLYRLLRGSGAKGLAGMPAQRALGQGQLIRPLLAASRAELEAYAQAQDLVWVEDESNAEDKFDRNFLRNQVLPVMAQRWPDYRQSLQLSSDQSKEADQLAESLAGEDMAQLDCREERAGWSICIENFMQFSDLRQRNILRHWPGLHGMAAPNKKIITEINDCVIGVREDAQPVVAWQAMQWRRFQGRLYLLRSNICDFAPEQRYQWSMEQILQLADNSHIAVYEVMGEGLALKAGQSVTLCYRQGGERCKPVGRCHSNSLKKLFLEYGIEPWWRDRMPLLYVDETLVAVGDCWVCDGWQAQQGQSGKKIRWQANSL
ncbi:MAG: tRNA lysidine(34) synthetase TilS [Porticoccaceae bacterium]|nr:tRNA lysidine(34) synthetase TilS [Porticoccaceae bacterium]MDG1310902.1 tRNA lysidine(34) synthetase TilS [Porticoccaceae bacterium]